MSTTIDERVVEMRFDNKQFESATKQTLMTIQKLKQALNFKDHAKSFNEINQASKNMDLSGIASGVDMLTKRFSTMGIVGMRVVENLTDSFMGFAKRGVNFVTDSIVSGGIRRAMNIENAHFQLQALLKGEAKVQAVMDDAMKSVDGTAYAYDEAAKAAAQFSASGVQAGEDMLGALKGITGVAAMTNSSFESISMIFTTVAGNGRLMGDQLLQLSSRGLNAASTIADYFKEVRGQAGITEGAIREMVTKGQIDFKTFSDAMTWAFGESAERANETFTGAFSNMKSALARIGAGFISPLIEQNSEMVNLFNILRIKINDVKSALVFDEQTSALSGLAKESSILVDTVGRFTRDGKIGFETFTKSILGTSKSEEELLEVNEKLSNTFEAIKEKGHLTIDTLKELEGDGTNAARALYNYINGVADGSVKVSYSTKRAISEITGGTSIIFKDMGKLIEEGKISYEIFTDAIINSSGAISNETSVIKDSFKALFDEVKESGSMSYEVMKELQDNGIYAGKALRDYINGVLDGSIRASYSTKQAIDEISNGSKVLFKDVAILAKEGKISFEVFQSAMEHTYGDQKALSKQFTDSFLDMIKNVVGGLQNLDLTKPMEAFNYTIKGIMNTMGGFGSALGPISKAFSEAFFNFDGNKLVDLAMSFESLTSKFRMTSKGSKNLKDTFKGLFDVLSLVVDLFFKLLGIIIPIEEPIEAMSGGVLSLTGAMGRGLSKLTSWIRASEKLSNAYILIKTGFQNGTKSISEFIRKLIELGEKIYSLPVTQKGIENISVSFNALGKSVPGILEKIENGANRVGESLYNMIPIDIRNAFDNFGIQILELYSIIMYGDAEKAMAHLRSFRYAFYELGKAINKTIDESLPGLKDYIKNFKEGFTFDNVLKQISNMRKHLESFISWLTEKAAPIFKDFSWGGLISGGAGLGMVYSMIKMLKIFERLAKTSEKIPDILGSFKGVLAAYQADLKADRLKKIATAIAILAGSLVLLSFVDVEKMIPAAIALGILGSVLVFAASKFNSGISKLNETTNAMNIFARRFGSALKKIGRAIEIKAIGSMVKDFGKSIALIATSMIALALMYRKDSEALMAGVDIIKKIALALSALALIGTLIGSGLEKQANAFNAAAKAVVALSLSALIIIFALQKLFKMEFPDDWKLKVGILAGVLGGLAIIARAAGKAAGDTEGNSLKASPFIGLSAMLYVSLLSLEKLFKMELPKGNELKKKLLIFSGIFLALGFLVKTIGDANKAAGGGLKAMGSILAMCLFVATAVGALMILGLFPGDKLIKGALALGVVLFSLGKSLAGVAKISGKKDSYKTVLAMAIDVAAITAALGILSMIPVSKLTKSAIALGSILTILALDFNYISKISKKNTYLTVASMVGIIISVSLSLYQLAEQPWENMLASSAAMSATLLAFAGSFWVLSKSKKVKASVMTEFLAMCFAIIPIGGVLYKLAEQPWQSLASAGLGLSAVILSLAGAFDLISLVNVKPESIAAFLSGCVGVVGLGAILIPLAQQDWLSILAAGVSLSSIIESMGIAMVACAAAGKLGKAGLIGIGLLDAFILDLGLVIAAIGALTQKKGYNELMSSGASGLVLIGKALGDFVGSIVAGSIGGITKSLPKMGEDIAGFMQNAQPFFSSVGSINGEAMEGVKNLAAMFLLLATKDFLESIAFWKKDTSLIDFGEQLKSFGPYIKDFADDVKGIDASSVEGAAAAAEIMVKVAKGLPGQNGLAQKVFGGHSLAEFGEELVAFAHPIVDFANITTGITEDSVSGAVAAATLLSDLANGLPAQESWVTKIFGGHSLAEFAEELNAFGLPLLLFSTVVSGIKRDSVSGAVAASEMLSTLAEGLPNQGGWFNNQMSLSEFGEDLRTFGSSLSEFSLSIMTVNASQITAVAQALKSVIEISKMITEYGSSGYAIADFISGLESLGVKGLNEFLSIFMKSGDSITLAMNAMINYALIAIRNKNPEFNSSGKESADNYIKGIVMIYPLAVSTGTKLANQVINGIKIVIINFVLVGTQSANKYLEGIEKSYARASAVGKNLSDIVITGLNILGDSFYKAGSDSGSKYMDGLKEQLDKADSLIEETGKKSKNKTKSNTGFGFNEAFNNSINALSSAAKIIETMDPKITPVVDLSDVRESVDEVSRLFNETISQTALIVGDAASSFQRRNQTGRIKQSETEKPRIIEKYELIQNNYSPKTLSSIEIYRQTNNLLSIAESRRANK